MYGEKNKGIQGENESSVQPVWAPQPPLSLCLSVKGLAWIWWAGSSVLLCCGSHSWQCQAYLLHWIRNDWVMMGKWLPIPSWTATSKKLGVVFSDAFFTMAILLPQQHYDLQIWFTSNGLGIHWFRELLSFVVERQTKTPTNTLEKKGKVVGCEIDWKR